MLAFLHTQDPLGTLISNRPQLALDHFQRRREAVPSDMARYQKFVPRIRLTLSG